LGAKIKQKVALFWRQMGKSVDAANTGKANKPPYKPAADNSLQELPWALKARQKSLLDFFAQKPASSPGTLSRPQV